MRTIKVASWNIAGGCKISSLANQFDYQSENVDYFTKELKKHALDIVCLQESHSNKSYSIGKKIASDLGFKYIFDSPHNQSHINPNYHLTLSILSRLPFKSTVENPLPNPNFTKDFPDGRHYQSFDEKIQVVQIENFFIANTMLLPVGIFDESYTSHKNKNWVKQIEQTFLDLSTPLIFCGDFNFNQPSMLFPHLFKKNKFKNSLNNFVTRPHPVVKRLRPDKILYTSQFKLANSQVVKTDTDHYLCISEFIV